MTFVTMNGATESCARIFSSALLVSHCLVSPRNFTGPAYARCCSKIPVFTVSGVNLHLTWGQWSAATGTSAVHCAGGRTRARFDLSGLIPGGVYSIFHVTFNPTSHNPVCSNSGEVATVESFTADAGGNARLHAEDAGCLLDAEELRYDVIYHADGNTYGALPDRGDAVSGCRNSFGSDALRQFIIIQKFP